MYEFLYNFAKEFSLPHMRPKENQTEKPHQKNDNQKIENQVINDEDQKQKPAMKQKLLKDDIKEIFDIYCYQSNYSRSAIRIKKITLFGLVVFISSFIIGLISLLF